MKLRPNPSTIEPSSSDLEDAVQTLNESFDTSYRLEDFSLKYLGMLTVRELSQYDDFSSWVEFSPDDCDPSDSPEDCVDTMSSFRGEDWADMAKTWLRKGIPPIVVISSPEGTMIGDGRGRINFASLLDLPVPTFELSMRKRKKSR